MLLKTPKDGFASGLGDEGFSALSLAGEYQTAQQRHRKGGRPFRGGKISFQDLPAEFLPPPKKMLYQSSMQTLKELEIRAIRETLQKCKGNKSKTAKMLGISRKAFYKRLRDAEMRDAQHVSGARGQCRFYIDPSVRPFLKSEPF
jgi:DNA invertase Pin-like site-specific DNA recombinase